LHLGGNYITAEHGELHKVLNQETKASLTQDNGSVSVLSSAEWGYKFAAQ